MFKRLLLVSALCIGLMALLANEAKAWPLPSLPSGWPIVKSSDFTIIQKVQRVVCETIDGEEVCVTLDLYLRPTKLLYRWCNPGGQCDEYRGIPFQNKQVEIPYSEDITREQVSNKGVAYWERSWKPRELWDAIGEDNWPLCDDPIYGAPNCNWSLDLDYLIIGQVEILVDVWGYDKLDQLAWGDCAWGLFTRPEGGGVYSVVWYECSPPPLSP